MNLSEEEKQEMVSVYAEANPDCSCLILFSSNTGEILVGHTNSDRSGCLIHCDHYGISVGGKCPCGETV